MTIEEIIKVLDEIAEGFENLSAEVCARNDLRALWEGRAKGIRQAIALLKPHPDAQPNEPLTLEELRSMLDCPVWMVGDDEITETGWCLVHRCTNDAVEVIVPSGLIYRVISENIGEVCKFYRRPPKEETH